MRIRRSHPAPPDSRARPPRPGGGRVRRRDGGPRTRVGVPLGSFPVPGVPEPAATSPLRIRGYSVAWLPPLVLLVALALFDWNTGGDFRVTSWIVMVPGIAAALCGVWGTAAFAVISLLTYTLVDNAWPHEFQTGLPDFILVAIGGALATGASWVRLRNERRALHMRDVADTTRLTVLRPLPPRWGGLDHAAVYLAADSVAKVGGDFYDIQPSRHGTRVLLGDVQGKGLGAVDGAAVLLGSFRESGYHEPRLSTVAERLETRMRRHRYYCLRVGRDDGDRFATAVLLGFPPSERPGSRLEIVNFGHQPPLFVSPAGVRELVPGDGLPLGLGDLSDSPALVQRVAVRPDETVLLVTDGVTEARDAHGVFFPLFQSVTGMVAADPENARPERLVTLVRDATLAHCNGHLGDDTTIFAVRGAGAGTGAGFWDEEEPGGPPWETAQRHPRRRRVRRGRAP
ncbi:SpoIIE family protein phosphatase [Streptomyces sp. SID4919]|uniref:PP2C family protein-serine/threonine phosphatase n=1 Tax=Streptomyces sp. SID4919 TaxID=2690270 RepID=UPI000823B0A4|nr:MULTISPECIES: PP2C family protein-serine/threonine phosphatase [unclassified Streptomyces]MYY13141.1 SpoIIE family protein phosphatase [Streptomyces sp. SID4919]SCK37968.1 Stage II sporulation protein E (SpoIIE) [Streptomyces sp. AmelKG-E11A]